jgi:biopolymer transport protein TolR
MSATGPADRTSLSEINVTPLVDVMLVLLIIFMIAAPLINKGVEVNVPKTAPVTTAAELGAKLILDVRREGGSDVVYLGTRPVLLRDLAAEIKKSPKVQADKVVFLNAMPQVTYGFVVKVMAAAKASGFELGLVTRD